MHEIHKPKISLPAIKRKYWIIVLAYVSMFVLIMLISGDVIKLIVLSSLPFCVLLGMYVVNNPKRTFWICFFVLPFIPYSWGIGISPSLPNIAPHRLLFLLIWVVYLLHRKKNHNMFVLSLNAMDMLLIFLFVWLGISMFIANPINTAYYKWPTRGITLFMLFLVGKEMIRTTDDLWTVVTIFATQGFIMGAVGIIEAFTQYSLWVQLDRLFTPSYYAVSPYDSSRVLLGKIVRIKGTFTHSAAYGQYLSFLLPFCIGIMSRKRMFGMIAFSLALLAMIFSQSRGCYIAAIVSFMVFIFIARRILAIKVLGVVILTGVIITFFFSPLVIDLYKTTILKTVRSDGQWHNGMLLRASSPAVILRTTMNESPLFGLGPQRAIGHYIFAYRKAMDETSYAIWGAIENGIPYALGLEIYFGGIIIFMVYLSMYYRKVKNPDKHNLYVIFLIAFTAGMVNLHIQRLGVSLSNIIIVFAGIQGVYYHERYVTKSGGNNMLEVDARE